MRALALFLLAAPLGAAPWMPLDLEHGPCDLLPLGREAAYATAAAPDPSAPPASVGPDEIDALLRLLAREVQWIAARNAWRQRAADTRELARRQASARPALRDGAGDLFGLTGGGSVGEVTRIPDPAAAPAPESQPRHQAEREGRAAWFQVLPVDPATPGYAYTGTGGQRVGWREHPVHGGRRFHTGLDLGVDQGTPIHAIGAGKVIQAGAGGGFGNWLILEHAGGVRSFYAHMASAAKVRTGKVRAGQVVGYVGSTGTSTAPHLHFELWAPRASLPAYAKAWIAEGAYALDEAYMPGLGLLDPAKVADFTRRGGTPSGEGARAEPAAAD